MSYYSGRTTRLSLVGKKITYQVLQPSPAGKVSPTSNNLPLNLHWTAEHREGKENATIANVNIITYDMIMPESLACELLILAGPLDLA